MSTAVPMDSSLIRCALCGTDHIRYWFGTDFGCIGRCDSCGQVLRADQPQLDAQVALHQTSNLHEIPYALSSELAKIELTFCESFLDLCEKTAPHGKLLDVGCGTGEFLKLALDRAFDIDLIV